MGRGGGSCWRGFGWRGRRGGFVGCFLGGSCKGKFMFAFAILMGGGIPSDVA